MLPPLWTLSLGWIKFAMPDSNSNDILYDSQSLTQFIEKHDGAVFVERKTRFLNRTFGRCTRGFVKGADEDCPDDRKDDSCE